MTSKQDGRKQQEQLQLGAIVHDAQVEHPVVRLGVRTDGHASPITGNIINRRQPGGLEMVSGSVAVER